MELCVGQGFCQPVYNHLRSWNVLEVDLPSSHFIRNIVVLNVNMFCSSVIDKVIGKGNGSLIVIFERDGGVC